jgi:hypothetical protein
MRDREVIRLLGAGRMAKRKPKRAWPDLTYRELRKIAIVHLRRERSSWPKGGGFPN